MIGRCRSSFSATCPKELLDFSACGGSGLWLIANAAEAVPHPRRQLRHVKAVEGPGYTTILTAAGVVSLFTASWHDLAGVMSSSPPRSIRTGTAVFHGSRARQSG